MSRLMKYASLAGKQIPIYVASEVQDAGFKRVIDAIDSVTLNETVEKVKSALEKNNLLSESQALRTSSVTITSMLHTSEIDADEHSTVLMKDSHGRDVAKGHVTSDEGKQQEAR